MAQSWPKPHDMTLDLTKTYTATIVTNKGTMELELFASEAPMTVNNFVSLARAGFYDGVVFHRVVKGFMIQGGDPTGSGSGGPGYKFRDEPVTRDYKRGTVAMANAGPNTNGSQFFICHADAGLPKNYTIFGQVTTGLDTVDAIAAVPVTAGNGGERSKPTETIKMESVTISEG